MTLTQPIVVGRGGTHIDVITAAAKASALVFSLDPLNSTRRQVWDAWAAEDMRKIVKHTSTSHVYEIAVEHGYGLVVVNGVVAAAGRPSEREQWPDRVQRAQASGLDRERSMDPTGRSEGLWVVLNGALGMSTGKAAAQAAHVTTLLLQRARREGWPLESYVRMDQVRFAEVSGERFAQLTAPAAQPLEVVVDNGLTEIPAGSRTAALVRA